jgi:hypothetical protein
MFVLTQDPTNILIGLVVTFLVLLARLLWNLISRRPSGLVAACCVVLGMFLIYQLALDLPATKGLASFGNREWAIHR